MHTLPNLPPSVAREVLATLCATLPPPVADTAEARAARDETAMAAVAALHPADAFEALLAAQIVEADAHAMDCLRLAVQAGQQPEDVRRCRAQAATMMRHMQSGLRALQRTQSMREKAEATMHPAAMDRAGYWFRDASPPLPPSPAQADAPQPADLTDAEQYAAVYPDRAARIRAHGGLPMRLDFGPPDPAVVDALVNGTSPILRALDHRPPAAAAA
jgi:hypothetical protein